MDESNKRAQPMFTVNEYKVSFSRGNTMMDGRRATYCFITDDKGWPVATGVALCSKSDNFNRNVGRKIALKRALDELFHDDRANRTLFWQAYFAARGKVN